MERDYQEKLAKKSLMEEEKRKRPDSLKVYKKPPNFDKIHKEFDEAMERKRKENKTTQPQEFNFGQSRPKSAVNKNNVSANQFA